MNRSAVFSLVLAAVVSSSDAFAMVGTHKSIGFDTGRKASRPVGTFLAAEQDDTAEGEQDEEVIEITSDAKPDATTDILNSPGFLKRKLEVLESDMEKAQADLADAEARVEAGKAEWGPQLEGLKKEYANIQQRMNSQSNQSDDMATTQVVRQMLEVMDNFDRAFGQVTPENDEQADIEARYKGVYAEILDIFGRLGVEEVQTVGTEFDYEVHQAVMQRPAEDFEEGVVCEELAKGFKIGDTLIRAAMVVVAV